MKGTIFTMFLVVASTMGIFLGGKQRATPMHQVQLTQQGYIQFLKWDLPVPAIKEFTFCLWVQSTNLTHPHSIFSYSKDERERLIRGWISSHGRSVHLEIGGVSVFDVETNIRENRWYHICQSWENRHGRYALWIDGRVKVQGHSLETIEHVVPRAGDMVVGQEYTDFDKGLEEGVEGSIFGFNLLLASAFGPLVNYPTSQKSIDSTPNFPSGSMKILRQDSRPRIALVTFPLSRRKRTAKSRRRRLTIDHWESSRILNESERDVFRIEEEPKVRSPLGLQLVQLSYVHCEIGRGSPFIGGHLMLISWTRTPVRVFGGAIVKNARSTCGKF